MSFSAPKVKADPLLKQEQLAAKNDKIDTIRDQVAALTDNLVRLYGAKVSLGGAGGPSGPAVPTGGTATTGGPKSPFAFPGGLRGQQVGPVPLINMVGH